jgi:hypothetical protein
MMIDMTIDKTGFCMNCANMMDVFEAG